MNLSPRQPAGGQHTRLRPIDTVRPASSPGTSSVPRVVGEDGGSMGDGRGGGDYFSVRPHLNPPAVIPAPGSLRARG